jgi:hypothetical protein
MLFPLHIVLCNISEGEVNIAHSRAVFSIAASKPHVVQSEGETNGNL